MFKYSDELIKKTINCFKEEDSLDISKEIAIEYCDKLSGLFLAFSKKD